MWLLTEFWLVIRFIEHLQIVTTNNYIANTNPHALEFTKALTKSSQSAIFTDRRLVTASNAVDSSASVFTFLLACDCVSTNSCSSNCRLKSKSEQLYDWRLTAYQFVLARSPLERPEIFFKLNTCRHSPPVTSSLTRGWICCLQLLLVSPAQSFSGPSPVILITTFYCLRFETSLFVASYDSQGHGAPPYIASVQTAQKHRFQQFSVVASLSVAAIT
jgi:hypothetical protein